MSNKTIAIIRNAAAYDFGGGERFPVFLAEVLGGLRFNPVIISRSKKLILFAKEKNIKTINGWWWKNQDWSGLKAILFPVYAFWQIILFFYYIVIFIRLNPRIVHVQSKDDFIAATFAARLLGKRVVWTDHADLKHIWKNVQIWYKNPIGKLVYVSALLAHAITVVSKSEYQLVTSNLASKSRIIPRLCVVYNGVVDESRLPSELGHKGIVYTVASRLVTDKGIGEIIEAFSRLNKEYSDVELTILGDGPECKRFKTQANSNKHIHFLGHQSDPLAYFANSDVFVHPTYHEGFSVALVEASMMSLPIIATGVGGNLEIIKNHKTGMLVEPKNTDELYLALKLLHDQPDLRKKLGAAARQQYEKNFDFNHIVSTQFLPLYGEVK